MQITAKRSVVARFSAAPATVPKPSLRRGARIESEKSLAYRPLGHNYPP